MPFANFQLLFDLHLLHSSNRPVSAIWSTLFFLSADVIYGWSLDSLMSASQRSFPSNSRILKRHLRLCAPFSKDAAIVTGGEGREEITVGKGYLKVELVIVHAMKPTASPMVNIVFKKL